MRSRTVFCAEGINRGDLEDDAYMREPFLVLLFWELEMKMLRSLDLWEDNALSWSLWNNIGRCHKFGIYLSFIVCNSHFFHYTSMLLFSRRQGIW